jgi:DNA-binding PucR family transcriptional regulator
MRDFLEAQLGSLRDYDHAHGARLIDTLDAYYASGRSLSGTARRLNAHRNTVLYRLRRIQELVDIDLHDPAVELELRVALQLRAAIADG